MGKNQEKASREREGEPRKSKEVCCEKYLKKGKHCKDCPLKQSGSQGRDGR